MAFTVSIAESKDKTTVLDRQDEKATPYASFIRQQIVTEAKRTHVPFQIAVQLTFHVYFELDRRGQLVSIKMLQGSNDAEADDYAIQIVRRASRNFPPLPKEMHRQPARFYIPINMGYIIQAPLRDTPPARRP